MDEVMFLVKYIRPELIILPVILYIIGNGIKKTKYIKDQLIPVTIGCVSLVLCAIYVLSVSATPKCYQDVLVLIYDIIIQGVCCAAAAVYFSQIKKQYLKIASQHTENDDNEDIDEEVKG